MLILGLGIFLAVSATIFLRWSGTKLYNFYLHQKYPLIYSEEISQYAALYSLDPFLVTAVIYEESRFSPVSRSDKNALGLMQILPETGLYIAEKLNEKDFQAEKLLDPAFNLRYGCYYLRYLLDKYGNNEEKALAAYNAGEGNVDAWLLAKDYKVKFQETSDFVKKVLATKIVYQKLYLF